VLGELHQFSRRVSGWEFGIGVQHVQVVRLSMLHPTTLGSIQTITHVWEFFCWRVQFRVGGVASRCGVGSRTIRRRGNGGRWLGRIGEGVI